MTWSIGAWQKFFVILVIAGSITVVLYEFGVRRWSLMRTIFGLKPLPPRVSETLVPIPLEAPTI